MQVYFHVKVKVNGGPNGSEVKHFSNKGHPLDVTDLDTACDMVKQMVANMGGVVVKWVRLSQYDDNKAVA